MNLITPPNLEPAPDRSLRTSADRRPLGAMLRERGLVTAAQLQDALKRQQSRDARLGELLRDVAGLDESRLMDVLSAQWKAERIDLVASPPDPMLVARLGAQRCLALKCIPWRHVGTGVVVATSLPHGFETRRAEIEAVLGPVTLALVTDTDLHACLATTCVADLRTRAESRVAEDLSCRTWRGNALRWAALSFAVLLIVAAICAPGALVAAISAISLTVLLLFNTLKLAAAIASRQRKATAQVLGLVGDDRLPVISVLVPLYREQEIAGRLVRRLEALRYPRALLDVCLVVEADDQTTEAALARAALPSWMRTIRVPHGTIKTKPRALNYALDFCRGTIIGIYDAEDAPAPDQIHKVVSHFARASPDVACLQGRLEFYNSSQNWLSRCFAIDYCQWFGVILPGIARLGLAVPLGGTTLFFRREILERLGGWDAHNVTEDADLGIRLTRQGYRTELLDSATREEANCHVWAWVRQRSRWQKGYAMTYATHMRDPRQLWRDLGPRAFIAFNIMFGGSLLQAMLAPVLWSWWLLWIGSAHPVSSALPEGVILGSLAMMVLVEMINTGIAGCALVRARRPGLLIWLPFFYVYNLLASISVYKALIELAHRPFFWDKTQHGLTEGGGPAAPSLIHPRPDRMLPV